MFFAVSNGTCLAKYSFVTSECVHLPNIVLFVMFDGWMKLRVCYAETLYQLHVLFSGELYDRMIALGELEKNVKEVIVTHFKLLSRSFFWRD
jgi:hypothetical protein